MDKVLVRAMAAELGVSPATLDPLRPIPFQQAVEGLEVLKQAAKENFQKLAVKYHPDTNPDDVEGATERFKALMLAKQVIEGLRVQPPMQRRQIRVVPLQTTTWRRANTTRTSYFPADFGGFSTVTTTTSGSGTGYDARRVVFIRAG